MTGPGQGYIPQNLEEILESPEQFGLPTFERWVRDRDAFLPKNTEALDSVSNGSTLLKSWEKRHVYELEGYRCRNLEEVERVARNLGIRKLDYTAELLPLGAGKADILIKFISKDEKAKRDGWNGTS